MVTQKMVLTLDNNSEHVDPWYLCYMVTQNMVLMLGGNSEHVS